MRVILIWLPLKILLMTAIVVWVVVWSDFAIAAGIGVLAMALLLGLLWIVMTTCNRVENRIKENDTAGENDEHIRKIRSLQCGLY